MHCLFNHLFDTSTNYDIEIILLTCIGFDNYCATISFSIGELDNTSNILEDIKIARWIESSGVRLARSYLKNVPLESFHLFSLFSDIRVVSMHRWTPIEAVWLVACGWLIANYHSQLICIVKTLNHHLFRLSHSAGCTQFFMFPARKNGDENFNSLFGSTQVHSMERATRAVWQRKTRR